MLRSVSRLALRAEPSLSRAAWGPTGVPSLQRHFAADPGSRVLEMGSDKEYDKLLSEYKGLVVTDFTAKWCGPCASTGPPKIRPSSSLFVSTLGG